MAASGVCIRNLPRNAALPSFTVVAEANEEEDRRPVIYRTYIPQPPLAAFVDLFWLYEGANPQYAKERRLPDGTIQLIINLREDTIRVYDRQHHERFQSFRGSVISGAHSQFSIIDTACQESIMGLQFKAGGAFPFLTLP